MRRAGSRLVGSVGYFPERYGKAVLSLAMDKAAGRDVPAATFVKHQMINPGNVDIAYPNDTLIEKAKAIRFCIAGAEAPQDLSGLKL